MLVVSLFNRAGALYIIRPSRADIRMIGRIENIPVIGLGYRQKDRQKITNISEIHVSCKLS